MKRALISSLVLIVLGATAVVSCNSTGGQTTQIDSAGVPALSNSFAQGTLVATPRGHVPIESLSVGDLVRSLDPVSGTWSDRPVLAVHAREATTSVVILDVAGESLTATEGHVVFSGSHRIMPGEARIQISGGLALTTVESLASGDVLASEGGSINVRNAMSAERTGTFYSIVVERDHTYAVTESSIAVADGAIAIAETYSARSGSRTSVGGSSRGGAGGCFPAYTDVAVPGGLASITAVSIGDAVLTLNDETGGSLVSRIVGVSQQAYQGDMISIRLAAGSLDATGNHPFRVVRGAGLESRPPAVDVSASERGNGDSGRWVEARDLKRGDLIATVTGVPMEVESTSSRTVSTTVYNLTVARHTYAVSSLGLVVHNKGGQEPSGASMSAADEPMPAMSEMPPGFNTEEYNRIFEPGFKRVIDEPLSTLSIDVDTAAYSNIRRFLQQGQLPPEDSVRIEEMINYFSYDYPDPGGDDPFSVITELSICPWNSDHALLHVGLQARRINFDSLPPNNLVFLLDVSGSMNEPNKLPLLKESLLLLTDQLRDIDHVSIVVYAGAAGLVLPPTSASDRDAIARAFDMLRAGGSTAGGEGITLAYRVAQEYFDPQGNNRVILGTDGDFNVGPSSQGALQRIIEQERQRGIYLTVLGFGMGNYKDARMETLADYGNGNYAYIDTIREARKVLVREIVGTLFTLANDVKIQIEFNPAVIDEYRVVGYENRLLEAEDFADDLKDAGELGAGHSVTVLYELKLAGGAPQPARALRYQSSTVNPTATTSGEMMFLKFRYKPPGAAQSLETTSPVPYALTDPDRISTDYRLSASIAAFGMLLRNSEYRGTASAPAIIAGVERTIANDPDGYRTELLGLVKLFEWMSPAR